MRGKEGKKKKKKEKGKRREREEKEKTIGDQIAKKEVRAHLLPLRGRHFFNQTEIRYLE